MAKGKLYLCGTPIGNLEDITLRALRILKEVDYIGAEDTRHTRKLLSHFHIKTRLFSCHAHNEKAKGDFIAAKLADGLNVALVSNAGMPVISDPGSSVVLRMLEKGFEVEVIPGVSAVTAALAVSGLPGDKFYFAGFLPRKSSLRKKRLEQLQEMDLPLVFFESPQRIVETLKELQEVWGDTIPTVITRELTKLHQEILRGDLASLVSELDKRSEVLGEITFVVDGRSIEKLAWGDESQVKNIILEFLSMGMSNKEIVQRLQRNIGWPRNKLYDYVLALKRKGAERQ